MHNLTGHTIKGYELRERVGSGGFGAVYRAYQPAVKREVAIKVILPEYARQPDFVRRFEVEAELIARLEHPHIVPLFDYWRDSGGAFLVMRWLRNTLHARLLEGALSLDRVAQVVDHIAAALATAHRRGIIHRDLKPANILLDDDGNAYLADFGIAKLPPDAHTPAAPEAYLGSPAYLAPEQLRGEAPSPAADIYSFGVMLFEMLTGVHPFAGDDTPRMVLLSRQLHDPLPALRDFAPDLPAALEAVIEKATQKEPAHRFTDMPALAHAFHESVANGHGAPYSVPVPMWTPVDVTPLRNPYKGLQPFREADAFDFFGREALAQRLLHRLEESRFVALVGPSGSGKSSAVKAGVIPALRAGALPGSAHWFIAEMVPGASPYIELENALGRLAVESVAAIGEALAADVFGLAHAVELILPEGEGELLLIIDQFEELFTQGAGDDFIQGFVEMVCAALEMPQSRLRILLTLRADFFDRPLRLPVLSDWMRECTEVITPLTPDELERCIVTPAAQVGVRLEGGLAAEIIADVYQQPGALPLLQYALTELFDRRVGHLLTLHAYRDIGGARGALTRRADAVFYQFSPRERAATRQLFLQLVALDDTGRDTRRRVPLAELESIGAETPAVLAALDRTRLLAFDRDPLTRAPLVEIAHEALLREWDLLRGWLESSRHERRLRRALALGAAEWRTSSEEVSYLLRGARLAQFEAWAEETPLALTPIERDYLTASLAENRRQVQYEHDRQAREMQLVRRSRARLALLAVFLLTAALIGMLLTAALFQQSRTTRHERDQARRAQVQSDSNAAAAQSLFLASEAEKALSDNRSDVALALALEAYRLNPTSEIVQRALISTAQGGSIRLRLVSGGKSFEGALYTRDGRFALAPQGDRQIALWDLTSGQLVRQFSGHTGTVQALALSPNGGYLLSGADDSSLILWEVASGVPVQRLLPANTPITDLQFSPDGRTALVATEGGSLVWVDLREGVVRGQMETYSGGLQSVAFSPDGRTALAAGNDGIVRLWNLADGRVIYAMRGHSALVRQVVFSPDGRYALSAGLDNLVIEWDLRSGTLRRRLEGHGGGVLAVAMSAEGNQALSASLDGTLIQWDLNAGGVQRRFKGHQAGIVSVQFSPDGRRALSTDVAGTLIEWDLNGAVGRSFSSHVLLSPDGRTLLEGVARIGSPVLAFSVHHPLPPLRLLDSQSGAEIALLPIQAARQAGDVIYDAAFSPDGGYLLLSILESGRRRVRLEVWDIQTGQLISRLGAISVPNLAFQHPVFSPDGRYVLAGEVNLLNWGGRFRMRLWETLRGNAVARFGVEDSYDGNSAAVTFLPTGDKALSGEVGGIIRMWELKSAQAIRILSGHSGAVNQIVVAADGRTALSASADRSLRRWDLAEGTLLHVYSGHRAEVTTVALRPDGHIAASGDTEGVIILWNVASGERFAEWHSSGGRITALQFSPDGATLFSNSGDGTAQQWHIPPYTTIAELLAWLPANRAIPELSCEERAVYRLQPLCAPHLPATRTAFPTLTPSPFLSATADNSPGTTTATRTPSLSPSETPTLLPATATPYLLPTPTATLTSIRQIAPGETVQAVLTPRRRDLWSFAAAAGQRITISVAGATPVRLTLRDPAQRILNQSLTGGLNEVTVPADGLYTLIVDMRPDAADVPIIAYTLRLDIE